MTHAESWNWRKNTAHTGSHCVHGKWWSEDCARCVALREDEERYSAEGRPE